MTRKRSRKSFIALRIVLKTRLLRQLRERRFFLFPPSACQLAPLTMPAQEKPQTVALRRHSRFVTELALLFWHMITRVFFREIRLRGAFNVPRDGPVIFVGAPHSNQVSTIRCHDVLHRLTLNFSFSIHCSSSWKYTASRAALCNFSLLLRA